MCFRNLFLNVSVTTIKYIYSFLLSLLRIHTKFPSSFKINNQLRWAFITYEIKKMITRDFVTKWTDAILYRFRKDVFFCWCFLLFWCQHQPFWMAARWRQGLWASAAVTHLHSAAWVSYLRTPADCGWLSDRCLTWSFGSCWRFCFLTSTELSPSPDEWGLAFCFTSPPWRIPASTPTFAESVGAFSFGHWSSVFLYLFFFLQLVK